MKSFGLAIFCLALAGCAAVVAQPDLSGPATPSEPGPPRSTPGSDEEEVAYFPGEETNGSVFWTNLRDGPLDEEGPPLRHLVDFPDDRDDRPQATALARGVRTFVDYQIAPQDDPAAPTEETSPLAAALADELASGDEDDYFFVRFRCRGCAAGDSPQADQDLIFSQADGASNTLRFSFTPELPEGSEEAAGQTEIALEIFRDALVYDYVVFRACTFASEGDVDECLSRSAEPEEEVVENVNADNRISFGSLPDSEYVYNRRRQTGGAVDIHIRLLTRGVDADLPSGDPRRNVTRVDIYDHDLIQALQQSGIASRNLLRASGGVASYEFTPSVGNFETKAERFYLQLTCLVLPKTVAATPAGQVTERARFRQELEDELGNTVCADPLTPAGALWSPENTQYAGGRLALIGQEIRKVLFPTGEDGAFVQFLADFAAQRIAEGRTPLKLLVDTPDFYLPYQLMHPGSGFDADEPRFFGMVFDLANQPDNFPLQSPNVAIGAPMSHLAFAGYTDETMPDDAVAARSLSHYQRISGMITRSGGVASPLITDTDGFVSYLTQQRDVVDVIWAYSHGESRGWSRAAGFSSISPSPSLLLRRDATGRYDRLTPDKLTAISFASSSLQALSAAPLIVLIACETNAPNLGGAGGDTLVATLTELGASSVVTTEAEINANSATLFGAFLLGQLQSPGQGPSQAMLRARRQLYDEYGDLWGLLFAYSGPHGWLLLTV